MWCIKKWLAAWQTPNRLVDSLMTISTTVCLWKGHNSSQQLIWPVVNKRDQHIKPADFWLQSERLLPSGAAAWIYIYLHLYIYINASVMYLFSCVLLILRVQGLQHFALIQLPHWIHSWSLCCSALCRVSSSCCRLVSVGPTLSCFHAWRFQQLSGAGTLFSTVS